MAKKNENEMVFGAEVEEAAGVQSKNMQTTVTVGEDMPLVDTEKFENRAKFVQNGDIKDAETGESVIAKKMVEEAQQYQCSKAVVKPFPATGAEYLATLDFKVSQ